MESFNAVEQEVWDRFISQYDLSDQKAEQLRKYLFLLLEENKKINLTAITSVQDVIKFHFDDSLKISNFVDFSKIKSICDVGTGGGFPGIPLKIMFPHVKVFLIEVIQKKVNFLKKVIEQLSLDSVEVCDLDWRTFLRKSSNEVDLFCARASLQPKELIRLFSPALPYKNAKLIYWASDKWKPSDKVANFIEYEKEYVIDDKRRKLVFLGLK